MAVFSFSFLLSIPFCTKDQNIPSQRFIVFQEDVRQVVSGECHCVNFLFFFSEVISFY